jgi:hypothetical protein
MKLGAKDTEGRKFWTTLVCVFAELPPGDRMMLAGKLNSGATWGDLPLWVRQLIQAHAER